MAILLTAVLLSACQQSVADSQEPPPSPTATINFADLPPIVPTLPGETTPTPVGVVTATPADLPTTPPPTPTAALLLNPTPLDAAWQACEDSPPSYLHVGDRAAISYEPYLPTRVRTRPGRTTSSVLGVVIPGEVVEILEGPACTDQAVWWMVRSLRKDLEGWVQEGDEESRWLYRTDPDRVGRVPPPTEVPCPVDDESFCDFIKALESPIVRGDFAAILAVTGVTPCPPTEGEADGRVPSPETAGMACALWGTLGSGLGGLDLTQTALIEPAWSTYAAPPRRVQALLLPPYEGVNPALPASPAVFIQTEDPLWDWLMFVDNREEGWQITAFVMVARDAEAYPLLEGKQVLWP